MDNPDATPPFTGPDRREVGRLYGRTATELTGPLQPTADVVRYREAMSPRQRRGVLLLGWTHVLVALALTVVVLLPGHLPLLGVHPVSDALSVLGVAVMAALQLTTAVRTWTITYHAGRTLDPIPMRPVPGLRVAVLTTIVPGKEPVELVMATLRAMRRIRHDGVLDVWLLDEGDDPEVRRRCTEIGVRHFSRKNRPEWNQPSGPFRARTKHGNHNSWRVDHELEYDVVAQMDPDHVPFPNFLERTLGYFADPDVAFVVAPQVYGNLTESFVARGAAELAYLFHGIIQRGGNGHDAPLLIGTNHLYRPVAFRQIGGYQDSIIEDHLTSMALYASVNPGTGRTWKGVYTPDVLAVGEGPATYSDFFSQQKRWAYGIWQIAREHSPAVLPRMASAQQRRAFVALQSHYPTTALTWVGGVFLSALYLVGGVTATHLPLQLWSVLFAVNMGLGLAFCFGMRRFNLVEHERRSWGLAGMALDLLTAPVYVAAAAAQLAGRPLTYVVTAKGSAATRDTWRTFRPHLLWAGLAVAAMASGLLLGHRYPALYIWAALTVVISLAGVAHVAIIGALHRLPIRAESRRPVVPARRIGEVLVARGLITGAQLRHLLDLQATREEGWLPLGDLAIEEGLVTPALLGRSMVPEQRQSSPEPQPA